VVSGVSLKFYVFHGVEENMLTKDLMTTNVTTVNPGHSIWHAAQMMLDHDVSGLPVINDDGHLVGMLTQGDLLHRIELGPETPAGSLAPEQRLGAYVKAHGWKVSDVMTSNVISVDEKTPIQVVAKLMDQHRIRRMPVIRAGKLVGVISRKDLLRVIATVKRHTIPPGNEAMQRAVQARLVENADLKGAHVTVTASDGVVHLGGTVGSDAERRVACVIAENVPGVMDVCDEMKVVHGTGGSPGDARPRP
jgi:CBS domain-containing protein